MRAAKSVDVKKKTKVPLNQTLIELVPYGVNLLGDGVRPVLLLRDSSGIHNLSVPLNAIEAGVALSQSNKVSKPASPHRGAVAIFRSLNLEIEKAVFEKVENQRQMMRIFFKNHPTQKSLVVTADEALSLCLFLEVPLYSSLSFIHESQQMLSTLEGMIEGMKMDPKVLKRDHAYIQ
jgi:hypothetical protein